MEGALGISESILYITTLGIYCCLTNHSKIYKINAKAFILFMDLQLV